MRYPYPGGVGVPRLGRPCRLRALLLVLQDSVIDIVGKHESRFGRKLFLVENFSEENFDAEGGPPLLAPEGGSDFVEARLILP